MRLTLPPCFEALAGRLPLLLALAGCLAASACARNLPLPASEWGPSARAWDISDAPALPSASVPLPPPPPPVDLRGIRPHVGDSGSWQDGARLYRARRKSLALALAGTGAVIGYGLVFWDYGSNPFHFRDDGLFGKDTIYGGADKAGHAVAASVGTAVFAGINRSWGIPRKESALRGALTAFLVMSMIEVGDGFTKVHGFTYGDLVGDAVGCAFGYLRESSPWFQQTFDLRWEYWPTDRVLSGKDFDVTSDYEGSAYLLAINVGSVVGRPQSLLDLVDLHVGYETRHYQDLKGAPERNVFVGAGLNLSNVFRRLGWRVPAKIFEYYQIPGISLRFATDLNDL